MKAFLLTAAILLGLAAPAAAQLHVQTTTNDPVTGLNAQDWETMVGHILHLSALIGEPAVLMANSTPEELTVTCDKWTLVGPNSYIKGNPVSLPPFTVTYVKTKGFDGYCKSGVDGQSSLRSYTGKISSGDHSFSNATLIIFSGTQR